MTTTPLMGLVLPDEGGSADVWDTILATLFGRVDGHNHTTGLGAKVPTGGLNIDADLSFSPAGTPRAITNLKAIDFSAVAASSVTSFAGAFFVSDGTGGLIANELYFRTTSGVNVRITSGAALNVAGFVGGIGGDYSAVGALLDYDDATDTYRFRQETAAAVRQFAKVKFADIQLIEYDPSGDASVPAFAVTIKSPDALAGNYNLIAPTGLPGSTSLVQLDSAGQLSASNTVANAVTFQSTLGVTGASTLTGGIANNVTLTSGATAAANQHVTVSGTGEYKHGDAILNLGPHAISGTAVTTSVGSASIGNQNSQLAVPLKTGDRIKSVVFARFGDGACDVTVTVFRVTSANVQTDIGNTTVVNAPAAWADTTIDVTDTTVTSGDMIVLSFVAGAGSWSLGSVRVTYDHP